MHQNRRVTMAEYLYAPQPFDVQSIFIVAFQCNKNLPSLLYSNSLAIETTANT